MNLTSAQENDQIRDRAVTALEWCFVGGIIILVLVITTLPYLFGYVTAPPDKQFMGTMLDVPDHMQYYSWMRELSNAFLSANKLTPEPNPPIFFNLLWWGMGRIGQLLGLGFAGMYQLLRFSATIFLLLVVYRMCAWFFADRISRQTAFLVVVFTSGFGWVLILLKYTLTRGETLFPLDIFIAEGNTFLGILGYPHFIAAALYILVFDLFLRGESNHRWIYPVFAGLFALFLGWQHAYDLISVYGVLAAYAGLRLFRDKKLSRYIFLSCLIIGLISCWPAIYSLWLTSVDPLWKQVLAQFANAGVYTPNLLHLPILLGPAFLLAIFTVLRDNPLHLNGISDDDLFIRGWFLISFVLVYLPVDYQIHLINGWQVPIAFLATRGLYRYIYPRVSQLIQKKKWSWTHSTVQRGLGIVMILVILPTNLYLWSWRFIELGRHDYPYYLSHSEVSALSWLEKNVKSDDVVFSSLTIGQYLPAWSGAHAFLAHWAQTVDFYGKSQIVEDFYNAGGDMSQREAILKRYSVDYVFYGPAERSLGGFDPQQVPFLRQVYSLSPVDIYQVVLP